jgi:predicted regulator of Ras-like GTPase activity (Roadblock/LC7/MglB family)
VGNKVLAREIDVRPRVRSVLDRLRQKIAGTKAIVVVRLDGVVVDHVTANSVADPDLLAAEFATLLRIARRTSADTGIGDVIEHILVSENAITIARQISAGQFLIVVTGISDQIGRARYEIKQAAWELRES